MDSDSLRYAPLCRALDIWSNDFIITTIPYCLPGDFHVHVGSGSAAPSQPMYESLTTWLHKPNQPDRLQDISRKRIVTN
ncbi:MAG TPA: hypothetical protein VJZ75_06780 [Candidatus Bathyarchaeia archaeon]|nr:hypothetical protein [Candidatus Bathyarchaeia archaeon]